MYRSSVRGVDGENMEKMLSKNIYDLQAGRADPKRHHLFQIESLGPSYIHTTIQGEDPYTGDEDGCMQRALNAKGVSGGDSLDVDRQ